MPLQVIPANEYRRERWRNGQGWTREIVTGRMPEASATQAPLAEALAAVEVASAISLRQDASTPAGAAAQSHPWDWRLSIAEIERDCPFSAFAGCDRGLVLLSGNGMHLDFADGSHVHLEPPHGRVVFSGENAAQCRLVDGPTTDFNAMVRRDRCTMQVFHRPLVGSMVFFAEAGVLWAIHLMAGRATVKSADVRASLDAGDTVLLDNLNGEMPARSILDGGGDVLLVRIQRC
jgi:uncharacterized protein